MERLDSGGQGPISVCSATEEEEEEEEKEKEEDRNRGAEVSYLISSSRECVMPMNTKNQLSFILFEDAMSRPPYFKSTLSQIT